MSRLVRIPLTLSVVLLFVLIISTVATARDLDTIRNEGILRHLGVPYANFVTGQGDGLSVELMQMFAVHLGLRYEFIRSDWSSIISDLVGAHIHLNDGLATLGEKLPVRGDIIATGLTVIPWREQLMDYSEPTFPTQVWLVAEASSPLKPITPAGLEADILATRQLLTGQRLLGMRNTCLDPTLYPFANDPFETIYFSGSLNEMMPAVLEGKADITLLDVPDALVALNTWPGQIKVLGPLSEEQLMGVAFRKDSPQLRQAFNAFYRELKANGTYRQLIKKYYPDVFYYYPEFF